MSEKGLEEATARTNEFMGDNRMLESSSSGRVPVGGRLWVGGGPGFRHACFASSLKFQAHPRD